MAGSTSLEVALLAPVLAIATVGGRFMRLLKVCLSDVTALRPIRGLDACDRGSMHFNAIKRPIISTSPQLFPVHSGISTGTGLTLARREA